MNFGICLSNNELINGKEYGSDYVETNCCAVYGLSDSEFSALKKELSDNEVITYSCNGLVPGEVRLTGDVNFDTVREYAKKAFGRMAEIGVNMLVFGSSAAKHVPNGFSFDKAWEQLYEVGRIFSDTAGQYGQTIAVEPLRRFEVNIVNTLEDGANYVKTLNRDNFRLLADFFHVSENGEPMSDVVKYKDLIVHTHIACPGTRKMLTEEHSDFLTEVFSALKEAGYNGGMSFEGAANPGFEGITEMLDMMRKYDK